MADQLLETVQNALEGQIDFEGQRLADSLTTALLVLTGVVAFLVGVSSQDIHLTLYTGLAGTTLTFLLVVPPWPYFNQHPVKWLPSGRGTIASGIEVDGQKIN
ncbi:MAG: hypothetical protein M1816_000310 [Peltula sp. TS41687]|nr:MAG: hypothetical protein M1816_000310 [Peltula sp. TS41687]